MNTSLALGEVAVCLLIIFGFLWLMLRELRSVAAATVVRALKKTGYIPPDDAEDEETGDE